MARATCEDLPGALRWLCARRSALAVLLVGTTLSVLLYAFAARAERQGLQEKFLHHSRDLTLALSTAMQGYVREMGAVARLYYASDDVTRSDFRTFVTPFLKRDPGVEAVGWVPRVTGEQRASYEASMRADGFAGFQISQLGPDGVPVRRQDADEYFPITYLEPSKGNGTTMGFDLASNAARDQTLEQARASGQPEATGRVRLVQKDANGGFLVLYPVYENGVPRDTEADRCENLKGFVDFTFRLDNVVQTAFNAMRPLNINVLVRDGSVPAGAGYLAHYSGRTRTATTIGSPSPDAHPAMTYRSVLNVAGRRWELTLTPTPAFMAHLRGSYSDGLLALSLVLSVALAVVHQRRVNESERVERLVDERTTALSKANRLLTTEVARRQEAQAALREARDNLEQKVAERTAELVEANQSLTEAVCAREKAQDELQSTNEQLEEALVQVQRAQKAVVQQERMHALAQMASGIAHDFNNSLSQILGFTELLLSNPHDLADGEKAGRFLNFIHDAASHAADVVRRMRTFYRNAEEEDTEMPVILASLIDEAVATTEPRWKDLARARGVEVEIRREVEDVSPVRGSPRELSEMLANLLLNAAESMSESGTITVSVRGRDDMVRLSVADTGRGMSEEVARRCAEPFYSTKGPEGSGLGLSTVRGVVKRHGGRLTVESVPGQGTTVSVDLPAWRPAPSREPDAGVSNRALRVLLVDDDPAVGEVLEGFLSSAGHSVMTVHNGQEALDRLAKDSFDVVVTDRSMPDMSGDQLAKAAKQHTPGRPVIMVTGFGDLMADAGEDVTGVDLVVPKPVSMERLRQAVVEVTAGV